ncbi:MAG TPA: hypothetical protein DEA08_09710, partial [Planctomycetes bacterium]|nr:hypothetical protein [Planctomycetota bacterium]
MLRPRTRSGRLAPLALEPSAERYVAFGNGGQAWLFDLVEEPYQDYIGSVGDTISLPKAKPQDKLGLDVLAIAVAPVGLLAYDVIRVVATGDATGVVRLWTFHTGVKRAGYGTRLLRTLQGAEGATRALAWAPDGALAAGGDDGLVRVWDPKQAEVRQTLSSDAPARVLRLAFAAGGRLLVSGCADGQVNVWSRGRPPARVLGPARRPYRRSRGSLAVTQLGLGAGLLVSLDREGLAQRYDLAASAYLGGAERFARALAAEGDRWAYARHRELVLRDARGEHTFPLQGQVRELAFAPGRDRLYAASDKGLLCFDLAERRELEPLARGACEHVAADGAGRVVFSAGRTVHGFEAGERRRSWSVEARDLALSSQGWVLAAEERETLVLDFASAEARASLPGRAPLACSPDGRLGVTTAADGRLQLWQGGRWQRPLRLLAPPARHAPSALSFASDGTLLSGGRSG